VENIENAMWVAIRTLEESARPGAVASPQRTRGSSMNLLASGYEEQARAAEPRASLIRSVLMEDKLPTVIKAARPAPRRASAPGTRGTRDPTRSAAE